MKDINTKVFDVVDILAKRGLLLAITHSEEFEVMNSNNEVLMSEIEDLDQLHSGLLGFDEGYTAAEKDYGVD